MHVYKGLFNIVNLFPFSLLKIKKYIFQPIIIKYVGLVFDIFIVVFKFNVLNNFSTQLMEETPESDLKLGLAVNVSLLLTTMIESL